MINRPKDSADDGPEVEIIRREMQIAAEEIFGSRIKLRWTCWDIDDHEVPFHIEVREGL